MVKITDLDCDAAFQAMTEVEKRTAGVGAQERSCPFHARERLAYSAHGEPDSGEGQLAHEREGGAHVFAHRERLLEHVFGRDEVAALEHHSALRANGIDHRGMRGQPDRLSTTQRLVR